MALVAADDDFEVPSETEVQLCDEPQSSSKDCCNQGCLHGCFGGKPKLENQSVRDPGSTAASTFDKKNEVRYEVLKTMLSHYPDISQAARKHRAFRSWDLDLCITAVAKILSTTSRSLKKLVDHLLQGFANPPTDGRVLAVRGQSDQRLAAGMIWNWVTSLHVKIIFWLFLF